MNVQKERYNVEIKSTYNKLELNHFFENLNSIVTLNAFEISNTINFENKTAE